MNIIILEKSNFGLIVPFQVKGHLSVQAAVYHCMVLLSDDVTSVHWSIYFISCDPVSSNQIRILINLIYYTYIHDSLK